MISDPIPVADATRVEVLGDGVHYSDILQAALSAKTGATVADLVEQVNAFYACGYAFVKVLPDPGSPEAKLADAAAELDASVNERKPRSPAFYPDDRVTHDVHGPGVVLTVGTDSCFVRFDSPETVTHGDREFTGPSERRVPTSELTPEVTVYPQDGE